MIALHNMKALQTIKRLYEDDEEEDGGGVQEQEQKQEHGEMGEGGDMNYGSSVFMVHAANVDRPPTCWPESPRSVVKSGKVSCAAVRPSGLDRGRHHAPGVLRNCVR